MRNSVLKRTDRQTDRQTDREKSALLELRFAAKNLVYQNKVNWESIDTGNGVKFILILTSLLY